MTGTKARGRRDRSRQRQRTRKDLLNAATRLVDSGRQPSLEEVAEEAMVSRATAYRYFPNIEALLLEAAMDLKVPTAEQLFGEGAPGDVLERLYRVDAVFEDLLFANEGALRNMLALLIHPGEGRGAKAAATLRRQNRRGPLIEAALSPLRDSLPKAAMERLTQALTVSLGPESFIATRDVLDLDRLAARRLRHWMIRSLLEATLHPGAVQSIQ